MTIKQRLEENVVIAVAVTAIAAFAAGWGVPEALRKNSGRVVVFENELHRLQEIEAHSKLTPALPLPDPRKRIAIVDNVRTVYDQMSLKRGRTNYDDIYDSLKSHQGLALFRVQTYAGWSDYNLLKELNPDVIVLHASAFYGDLNPTDEDKHLRGFLSYVSEHLASSRVVVYSRAIRTEADEGIYAAALINAAPRLAGRLTALSVPSGMSSTGEAKSSFQSAANISKLLAKIESAIAK